MVQSEGIGASVSVVFVNFVELIVSNKQVDADATLDRHIDGLPDECLQPTILHGGQVGRLAVTHR